MPSLGTATPVLVSPCPYKDPSLLPKQVLFYIFLYSVHLLKKGILATTVLEAKNVQKFEVRNYGVLPHYWCRGQ